MQPKVLQTRIDGSAVISTRGLRRVVSHPGGKIVVEFVRAAHAPELVKFYNSMNTNGERWAEAITYNEAAKRDAAKPTKKHAPKLKIARVA